MTDTPQRRNRSWLALVPALLFGVLALLFWRGLSGDPSEIPSALIGKPVPDFNLPAIAGSNWPGLESSALRAGSVTVVNVWASWCVPCREEQPMLEELAKRPDIKLYGINYKDKAENAKQFLLSLGQPFAAIGADESGRVAVDWGVYGVPETYIVDGTGLIRYKWIGPLTPAALSDTLAAQIEKAKTPLK